MTQHRQKARSLSKQTVLGSDIVASFALVAFWFFLAIAFAGMSVLTYRARRLLHTLLDRISFADFVRRAEESDRQGPKMPSRADIISDFQPDVVHLRPIFDHILILELVAFALTSASAFIEWLTVAGLLI